MSSEINKSYRIRTKVGGDSNEPYVHVLLDQDYDTFDILSMSISSDDTYRLHNANYGVIAGRVLANQGFGIPNAKISIFISADTESNSDEMQEIYGYSSPTDTNSDGIRYNLLPSTKVSDCHKAVGTFPSKTYLLDNDVLLEVFDKYYKLTTRTNASGDYMICGVPTGDTTLHMDLDLSDCGILSQKPRDFIYKGYNIEQFDSASQFKDSTNLSSLSQLFVQDKTVYVYPFWGNSDNGDTIGITRADIDVNFKFEPTCVFMGSIVSDPVSNGVSTKCIPTNRAGAMDELVTGEGTIEMIRYTQGGNIESFEIKGNQLIDGNGVWCYQIPMNLDYIVTDEYGNITPTDDTDKGIPTRARVRFRVSMSDFEDNNEGYYRAKILVPHNPQDTTTEPYEITNIYPQHEDYDYNFGTLTREDSFRDLMWNNVYTVKQYIPRFQYSRNYKNERFSGIKACNHFGSNNPMPYNNIRIKLPLMFILLCALIKAYIFILKILNNMVRIIVRIVGKLVAALASSNTGIDTSKITLYTVSDGLCPDLENWYFAPYSHYNIVGGSVIGKSGDNANDLYEYTGDTGEEWELIAGISDKNASFSGFNLFGQTLLAATEGEQESIDTKSIDESNKSSEETGMCLTTKTDYLINCIEMNLAQEYRVINFDFYNDWINGVLYFPRWASQYRPKKKYLFGLITIKEKIKGCFADNNIFSSRRYMVQQCGMEYTSETINGKKIFTNTTSEFGCSKYGQRCHKGGGFLKGHVFGNEGGFVKSQLTMLGDTVYYYKPCEWRHNNGDSDSHRKVKRHLYATDIVLLGSLNDCSLYGIPQAFKSLPGTSYLMPTNLALTNMDSDSYLYGTQDGYYCSGTGSSSDNESIGGGVSQISLTYNATNKFYSGTSVLAEDKITYTTPADIQENDPFPFTEAAGIAWNYSGPDQGSFDKNKKYYPGGHFLGISCTNPETNIKTCINLQRICEVGSSMSQRRTVVRNINTQGNLEKNIFKNNYFIPTGFISGDDVTNPSFRSMFASMNMKRLLCKNLDEKTGYRKYDFLYSRPVGFDGSFRKTISGSDGAYNEKVNIDTTDLNEFRKKLKSYSTTDTDVNDVIDNSYKRTMETINENYYMFRLGLTDLSDSATTLTKYIKYTSGSSITVSIPQYENSFYFYFGLKDGSTALDKFKEQFFAECPNDDSGSSAYMVIMKGEGIGDLSCTCSVYEMNGPYKYSLYNEDDELIYYTSTSISNQTFSCEDFGTYKIKVVDADDVTIEGSVTFSEPQIYASYKKSDIDFAISGTPLIIIASSLTTEYKYLAALNILKKSIKQDCGYFQFNRNIEIDGENHDIITGDCTVILYDPNSLLFYNTNTNVLFNTGTTIHINDNEIYNILPPNNIANNHTYFPPLSYGSGYVSYDENFVKMYAPFADIDYIIFIGYKAADGSVKYIKYTDNEHLYGVDNMDIIIGCKYMNYERLNKININTINDDNNGIDNWLYRHYVVKQSSSASSFDSNVYSIDRYGNYGNKLVLFGTPEKYNNVIFSGVSLGDEKLSTSKNQNKFYGYSLSHTNVYRGTNNPFSEESGRSMFNAITYADDIPGSKMLYTKDPQGNWLSPYTLELDSSYSSDTGMVVLTAKKRSSKYSKPNMKACILGVDGNYYFSSYDEDGMTDDCYFKFFTDEKIDIKAGATLNVYPAIRYPVIYRPFSTEVNYYTWDFNGIEKNICFGTVWNGITYQHHFGSGSTVFSGQTIDIAAIHSGETLDDLLMGDINRNIYFGRDGDNIISGLSYEGILSGVNYSIYEGRPYVSGITENELFNTPDSIEFKESTSYFNAAFAEDITTSKTSSGRYRFVATSSFNGDVTYYLITSGIENFNLPFETASGTCLGIEKGNNDDSYYKRVILRGLSSGNVMEIIPEHRQTYDLNGKTPKYIIAIGEKEEDGNVIRRFKFYIINNG